MRSGVVLKGHVTCVEQRGDFHHSEVAGLNTEWQSTGILFISVTLSEIRLFKVWWKFKTDDVECCSVSISSVNSICIVSELLNYWISHYEVISIFLKKLNVWMKLNAYHRSPSVDKFPFLANVYSWRRCETGIFL